MSNIARTPDGRIWEQQDDGYWYEMVRTKSFLYQSNMTEERGVVIYRVAELEKYGPGTVLQNPELRSMIASKIGDDTWMFAGFIGPVYSDKTVVKAFGDDGYEVIVEVKR